MRVRESMHGTQVTQARANPAVRRRRRPMAVSAWGHRARLVAGSRTKPLGGSGRARHVGRVQLVSCGGVPHHTASGGGAGKEAPSVTHTTCTSSSCGNTACCAMGRASPGGRRHGRGRPSRGPQKGVMHQAEEDAQAARRRSRQWPCRPWRRRRSQDEGTRRPAWLLGRGELPRRSLLSAEGAQRHPVQRAGRSAATGEATAVRDGPGTGQEAGAGCGVSRYWYGQRSVTHACMQCKQASMPACTKWHPPAYRLRRPPAPRGPCVRAPCARRRC